MPGARPVQDMAGVPTQGPEAARRRRWIGRELPRRHQHAEVRSPELPGPTVPDGCHPPGTPLRTPFPPIAGCITMQCISITAHASKLQQTSAPAAHSGAYKPLTCGNSGRGVKIALNSTNGNLPRGRGSLPPRKCRACELFSKLSPSRPRYSYAWFMHGDRKREEYAECLS